MGQLQHRSSPPVAQFRTGQKKHACLEYVVVHELVHLLERNHNACFMAYMDQFLPDWRERRQLLNEQPLGAV